MNYLLKAILVPGILIMSIPAMAKGISKTKAHRCAVYKSHAIKAGHLYTVNKKQARQLYYKIQALQKDQKRMPQSVPLTKKILTKKIAKLDAGKKQRLATSLKYLEKHLQFKKAAIKTCSHSPKQKPHRKPKNIHHVPKLMTIANY